MSRWKYQNPGKTNDALGALVSMVGIGVAIAIAVVILALLQ